MSKHHGALPDFWIERFIDGGMIKGADKKNIMPGSLNITLTDEMYRLEQAFLPRKGESVRTAFSYEMGIQKIEPGSIMEKDVQYLCRLNETLELPEDVYGYCNPRSSTGRNDVLVTVIADGVPRFDSVGTPGFKGELWCIISPQSYPVRVHPNQALTQLRLFNRDTRFSRDMELQVTMRNHPLIWNREGNPVPYEDVLKDGDGSILLTVDLDGDADGLVGWECLGSSSIMDFSKKNEYDPHRFFQPMHLNGNRDRVTLRKGAFYILYTSEYVHVPLHLACEMASMDARAGEFRTHYAGFIDPEWGKERGRRLVLEVSPFRRDVTFRRGQPVAKIQFEHMTEEPHQGYDSREGSSYTSHVGAPRLSSHFKME